MYFYQTLFINSSIKYYYDCDNSKLVYILYLNLKFDLQYIALYRLFAGQ